MIEEFRVVAVGKGGPLRDKGGAFRSQCERLRPAIKEAQVYLKIGTRKAFVTREAFRLVEAGCRDLAAFILGNGTAKPTEKPAPCA